MSYVNLGDAAADVDAVNRQRLATLFLQATGVWSSLLAAAIATTTASSAKASLVTAKADLARVNKVGLETISDTSLSLAEVKSRVDSFLTGYLGQLQGQMVAAGQSAKHQSMTGALVALRDAMIKVVKATVQTVVNTTVDALGPVGIGSILGVAAGIAGLIYLVKK